MLSPETSFARSEESRLSQPRTRRRRTIAVLLDYMTLLVGAYEREIRTAFDKTCRKLDLDLLLVYGEGIDEPSPGSAAHNAIYSLLGPDSVDGLVALTSSIATHCGLERMAAFLGRYGTLPLCSLGLELPGVPSVVVDHRAGMQALVEHLVEAHGRRRLAFIGGTPGHPDAEVRFRVYRDVLDNHAIAFDGALVATGWFMRDAARTAMEEILTRGVAFDAVVAANDMMAVAAIDVLRNHGIRVPHDIAVTGFDDAVMARLNSPPVTTVAQPFGAMAECAIELLMAQMAGREAPSRVMLPAEFIVRSSCGCTARASRKGSRPHNQLDTDAKDALFHHDAAFHAALAQSLSVDDVDGSSDAARLIDALRRELDGHKESFLDALEEILERAVTEPERCHALQNGITQLRERLHPSTLLEDLWHDARELVALFSTRGQVLHRNQIDASYARLLSFGEQVTSALDLSSLKGPLEKSLSAIGIHTVCLSRFSADTTDELEPFVSLVNGAPVETVSARFSASLLFPPEARTGERRQTLLVFPMVCETQNLGVGAFDYSEGINGYQMLTNQISAALRTVSLHREVILKTMLHERSLQERAATAKRMQSLSVLAGGVAHDLNNALGPLVGLPEIMLAELGQLGVAPDRTSELRADLETIRSASFRASQTIKDLLTLGRQGRTAKERLDLNRAVLDCLGGDSLRALREANCQVNVACDPASEPLVISGSEAHVGRAVTNLVRNAVEAVAGSGEVKIKTFGLHLNEPISGYETVEPGDYAVVVISDDGVGISPDEVGWVFEPFTSKKRVSETSGTGLGLAIVHGVIKEHEGFVDVASTVGIGTTFTLYFPRVDLSIRPVPHSELLPQGSARILVVDDEPIQLRTARRILTHFGYAVETVRSGRHALTLFAEAAVTGDGPCDLVLLDMNLNEDMDGLELFDEIRQRFPLQRAIIVSGQAPPEGVERAFAEGLGWLAKPYTAESLAGAVREALSRQGDDSSQCPSVRVPRSSTSRAPP